MLWALLLAPLPVATAPQPPAPVVDTQRVTAFAPLAPPPPAVGAADGELEVELSLPPHQQPEGTAGAPPEYLVSWASAGPETAIRYHTRGTAMPAAGSVKLSIHPAPGHLWLALLVESPASGAWGGTVLELPGSSLDGESPL